RRRLEQLQRRFAGGDEVRPHALRGHVLGGFHLQPERVAVERQGCIDDLDCDADVIQPDLHGCAPPFLACTPSGPPASSGRSSAWLSARRRIAPTSVYGSVSRAAIRSRTCCSSPGSSTCR